MKNGAVNQKLAFVIILAFMFAGCAPTVSGKLLYNGRPMSEISDDTPTFWFRDEDRGAIYNAASATYNPEDGTYTIKNLRRSPIGVSIRFHMTGERVTLPGNYDVWHVIDYGQVPRKQRERYDIALQRIIRLLEPVDSMNAIEYSEVEGGYPLYASPITFSWEALEGATGYAIIDMCGGMSHPGYSSEGCDGCRRVVSMPLESTAYTLHLPPSDEHAHYLFSVFAYNSGTEVIGKYMTTYRSGGYGWGYGFRIE